MSVENYQDLVDRGWRRSVCCPSAECQVYYLTTVCSSGTQYYKQDQSRACCPYYTIRLDASAFKATKSQRQTVNRWNRDVLGVEYIRRELVLCPRTREEKRHKRDRFDLQDAIHAPEYTKLKRPNSRKTGQPIEPVHKFEVHLEGDTFTAEKFELFLRYQVKVHKEDESRWSHASFTRFLCSGIKRKSVRTSGKTQNLGSYHQCYRLNGKLIAVGVLDLLLQAVSSVYLFYNPDLEQHELGKLTALREIALATEGHYQHYYMGFYIHNCVKMSYKATFQPTFMLDPESLRWNLFDEAYRKQLDKISYYSVSGSRGDEGDGQASQGAGGQPAKEFKSESQTTATSTSRKASEKTDLEVDPDDSSDSNTEIPDGSLFDQHLPGALTKEEVEALDLDHWKLRVRDTFVDLEVVHHQQRDCDNRLTLTRTFEAGTSGGLMIHTRSKV